MVRDIEPVIVLPYVIIISIGGILHDIPLTGIRFVPPGGGQYIFTALFNFTDVRVHYTGNRFEVSHGTSDSLLLTRALA